MQSQFDDSTKFKPPGSSMNSAQTRELQTVLIGQIARALAVFCVDEVVIFDDGTIKSNPRYQNNGDGSQTQHNGNSDHSYTGYSDPNYFFARVLSYLECPPHLRKALFPMHQDLKLAGTLPSLDMPHHLRKNEWCQYREGVTIGDGEAPHGKSESKEEKSRVHTLVRTGLDQNVYAEAAIPVNTRVTLKLSDKERNVDGLGKALHGIPVAPSAPREKVGYYWGYSVRSASSLSALITECPFDGGYDLTFGTSERGDPISEIDGPTGDKGPIPEFNHMMIVFGGVSGLEAAVRADKELEALGVRTPSALFDFWINLCPGQGSRTIRTEEALWMGLNGLRNVVLRKGIC